MPNEHALFLTSHFWQHLKLKPLLVCCNGIIVTMKEYKDKRSKGAIGSSDLLCRKCDFRLGRLKAKS